MASSLLAILDDVTLVLDDVAVMTKVATKKTASLLGDDLALNAEQVAGMRADRELPVVFAVAKGSVVNKAVLVPAALGLSAGAPWAVPPLMMLGGAFLCYEGFEKVAHKLLHTDAEDAAHHKELAAAVKDAAVDMVAFERDKIRGAVRTDFILSAELIVISLGSVSEAPLSVRAAVLAAVSAIMTVGVYGFVAGIVKLDDLGLALAEADGAAPGPRGALGRAILAFAPGFMRTLSVLGTTAMFLVGGGILSHALPGVSELSHHAAERGALAVTALDGAVGLAAGALLVAASAAVKKLRS